MIKINLNNPIINNTQSNSYEVKKHYKKQEIYQDKFVKSTSSKVSFQGLTQQLKNKAFRYSELVEVLTKYSKSNGWVGSIPEEWEKSIKTRFVLSRKGHSEIVKTLYQELGEIISDLRDSGQTTENIDKSAVRINNLMRETGILPDNKEFKFERIDEGRYGTGYKLGIKGDPNQYVIKIFHELKESNINNGNPVELNRGVFMRNYANEPNKSNGNEGNNSQFARFFFGDTNTGYILEQHIGDNKKPPKKMINPYIVGLDLRDFGPIENKHNIQSGYNSDGHNTKRGYNYEFGGINIISRLRARNKIAREVFEKVYTTSEKSRTKVWDNIYLHEHYGNKNHTLIGLAESLSLLPPEDRHDRFYMLATKGNNVKEALVDKLDCLPEDRIAECFKKLADGADNIVKIALADNLDWLPEDTIEEGFRILADRADNIVRNVLVDKLDCLPEDKFVECFKILTDGADSIVKKALVDNLDWLQENKIVKCFKILADGADNIVKIYLTDKLHYLPKDKRAECFKLLTDGADNNAKIALVDNLYWLQEDERVDGFKTLADGADNIVKKALVDNLHYLLKDKIVGCFKILADGADSIVKIALTDKLHYLPKDKRAECFKLLTDGADNNAKIALVDNLDWLPEDKRAECFEKLADGADAYFKQVLKDHLHCLPKDEQAVCEELLCA